MAILCVNQILFLFLLEGNFPNVDGGLEVPPTHGSTSQQSVNHSLEAAVCMVKTQTSERYYFGNNQPGKNKPNIWLRDTDQIAQQCQLNFRETTIGEAPIIDLVWQNPQDKLVSVAQYQQEACHHEPNR